MKGIVGIIGASVQENPGTAAGFVAFLVAFFLVSGNALYGQRGKHPGPLWATRDEHGNKGDREKSRKKSARAAPRPNCFRSFVQAPQVVPIPTLSRQGERSLNASQADLVRDIQSELAAAGYYSKDIDGRFGPNTQVAIRKFQAASGIAVNGLASADLLSTLRRRSIVALDARIEKVVANSGRSDAEQRQKRPSRSQGSLPKPGLACRGYARSDDRAHPDRTDQFRRNRGRS